MYLGYVVPGRPGGPEDKVEVLVYLAGLGRNVPSSHQVFVFVPGHETGRVQDVSHFNCVGVASGFIKLRDDNQLLWHLPVPLWVGVMIESNSFRLVRDCLTERAHSVHCALSTSSSSAALRTRCRVLNNFSTIPPGRFPSAGTPRSRPAEPGSRSIGRVQHIQCTYAGQGRLSDSRQSRLVGTAHLILQQFAGRRRRGYSRFPVPGDSDQCRDRRLGLRLALLRLRRPYGPAQALDWRTPRPEEGRFR